MVHASQSLRADVRQAGTVTLAASITDPTFHLLDGRVESKCFDTSL